ncbi:MAG: DNA repair protein RadA [Myxococcota bacterium]
MAKVRNVFVCQQCGHVTQSWMGKCPGCAEWNTLLEQSAGGKAAPRSAAPLTSRARPLSSVPLGDGGEVRLRIGIGELDRVLGGGLVTGALTLLGGDPGVGKSTLLLMAMQAFARKGIRVLYVSAEESARQVRLRAERLGVSADELFLLAETGLDAVAAAVEDVKPRVLVLDSVQTLQEPELDGVPGSISQVRQVAAKAMQIAKGKDIATFLVGHVTKDGNLAGPRVLEHLVDTVLYFEGDGSSALRILRATKNRFGSTGEIGMFEMREEGLAEVPDASARLLKERARGAAGTVVTCTLEGNRPLLVEVQALVGRPTQGNPARTAVGIDRGRLAVLLAVLGKAGLDLSDRDVFVSVAGGVRIQEPAADLAIAVAIHSSALDRPVEADLLVFGEVGLVGELRGVSQPGVRLREAERHGFRRARVPHSVAGESSGLSLVGARTLGEVLLGGA